VTRLVLGSASTGRLRVLRSAGIDPLVAVSGLDEDAIIAGLGAGTDPATVVNALAEAKARAVGASLDPEVAADAVVIGCDSMLDVDGELRGKPQTPEQARRQWNSMAGRSGQLFTGHCLIRLLDGDPIRVETAAAVTTVRFGVPTETELAAYIASGEPLGVAGAFTVDGLGGWFIDGVDGDPSNVVGLSLSLVRRMLNAAGTPVNDLWAHNPIG
jgi:septum formation protein